MVNIMERMWKLFENNDSYDFFVPFISMPSKVFVEEGQSVKSGQILYQRESHGMLKIIDIAKELNCTPEKSKNYICRIDGEFVMPEEVLAEKIEMNGLVTKKIISGVEGIVNFDSLDKGVLKIMSEKEIMSESVVISGIVKTIDLLKGITFTVKAKKFVPFAKSFSYKVDNVANSFGHENSLNYFKVIKQGDSVYTINDLEASYKECIVFAGKFIYPNLFQEIIDRCATAVIVYSMDYEDYLKVVPSEKILVVGGFGHINIDKNALAELKKYENKYVFVDQRNGGEILFLDNFNETSEKEDNSKTNKSEYGPIRSLSGMSSLKSSTDEGEKGVDYRNSNGNEKIELKSFDIDNFAQTFEFVEIPSDSSYVIVRNDDFNENKKVIGRRSLRIKG